MDGNVFTQNEINNYVSLYRSFGGSVILVSRNEILQFWHFSEGNPVLKEQNKINELDNFFAKYKNQFSPNRISRAKTLGQFDKENQQLSFHDFGLMPIIEKHEGEYLSKLIVRIINKLSASVNIDQRSDEGAKWLTQVAFWLVGAKILKDKCVPKFETLDITDIELVSNTIKHHYGAKVSLDISSQKKKSALEQAATEILEPVSSFSHLSINSLAYVYENTLVTPATRKALGTHATPSWLVNYIVWQLVDGIEDIPQKDRIIFEPTCGHAPFLTAGARILTFLHKGREPIHDYLKSHLIGLEKDIFAEEIARLALTLTDIPNKDGWQIINSNIYDTDILQKSAEKATILLCNPPFENFSPAVKEKYKSLLTGNKAAEVLARTLPFMREGSVFGIILPQGFLHKKNLANLRKELLDNYQIRKIINLPADKVFAKAGHPSCVLIGCKIQSNNDIYYVRIHKSNLENFINSYHAKEEIISKHDLYQANDFSFRVPELKNVWEYCHSCSVLEEIAEIGRGLEYKTEPKKGETYNSKKHLPQDVQTISNKRFPGSVPGYDKFAKDIKLTETPKLVWLNLAPEVISRPRWGTKMGVPQILLNSIRVGYGPWRLKALIDSKGYPVTTRFVVVRPKIKGWSLENIWAILNSPFANAYAYCHSLERNNQTDMIRSLPLPDCNSNSLLRITNLVRNYFALYASPKNILLSDADSKEAKRRMLAIDAEVMRLYNLPPKMEWQVLNLFDGQKRKGVDFDFKRYYPEGFESWIPLHEYLSEEYQRSTPSFVKKWVEEVRSPELIKALEIAMKTFED